MTEHTADLRREEIARGPQTEAGKRLASVIGKIARGESWEMDEPEAEMRIAAIEEQARSQDTATARIAAAAFYRAMHDHFGALDYESTPHDENCIVCREWVIAGFSARAVLSGETRRHDPTDHDCKGGVRGDKYPLSGETRTGGETE